MRRVRRLNPDTAPGRARTAKLFAVYRYHAVFTDSPEPMLAAEATHRDHAIIEQVIAELKNGPLAHLPSGMFTANAAWLACAAIAFNLTRAAGALAGGRHARSPHRHPAHPADPHPGPDRALRPPPGPAPAPGLALGSPGWTSCSAAPCTTPSPPPPDHQPDTGPTGDHQWKSRTDRRQPRARSSSRQSRRSTTEVVKINGESRLRREFAVVRPPPQDDPRTTPDGRVIQCCGDSGVCFARRIAIGAPARSSSLQSSLTS